MPVFSQSSVDIEAKRKELEELALFLMKTEKELETVRKETRRLQVETQAYLDQQAMHQALQAIHEHK